MPVPAPAPNDLTRVSPAPRWVAPLFAGLGALTIPWTIYLGATLPERTHTHNYREAWVGFDTMLVIALLLTAYLAWRGRRLVSLVAASTATMLVLDAWFDVLTSRPQDMASSLASAVLAELPLAILCGWIALHADRVAERRLRQLTRRVARLQDPNASPESQPATNTPKSAAPDGAPEDGATSDGASDAAASDGVISGAPALGGPGLDGVVAGRDAADDAAVNGVAPDGAGPSAPPSTPLRRPRPPSAQ